ncbi:unnamed protein product [Blepharisma stoltei]|uniref:LNR domain-containing protein n=1 Tax=Blepharisma stoltei TaxID=1481888 RepID=A0AAU9JQT2_9CILI|nr:unnamed protein product [Blepharisma stoltei]
MIRSLLICSLISLSLSSTPQQFITAPDLEATVFFEGECPPEGCPENNVCNCDESMLGDGICQWECVNFACNWDHGDCCENWMLYNDFCDAACYLEKFKWDQGACKKPLGKCKCSWNDIGNGFCNWHCSDHIECLMEGGDCCFYFEVGDGRCEEYCYNIENNWDGGDCFKNPPKDCPCYEKGLLGDGVCNKECDTEECVHDFGDCCDEKLLGNGVCDESCNTEVLDFDGGDCLN